MVKISFIRQVPHVLKPTEIKGLRYAPEYLPDMVSISKKSFLAEFRDCLETLSGKNDILSCKSETILEYFRYCREKEQKTAGILDGTRLIRPKLSNDNLVSVRSLSLFRKFIQETSVNASKEEYHGIVDKIAELMPEYMKSRHPNLCSEITERSGDISRWRAYLDVEKKVDDRLVQTKFFDAQKKEQALSEYIEFVENLTGKKVLVGSPTRMSIAVDELGLLNDPNSYKDVDYILFGHGKGSSLITDIENPDTWRFSDNDQSIWKFIEENVPKGKRVLVGCCEKDKFWRSDGIIPKERKALAEMYDKSGYYMWGVGNSVCTDFSQTMPAKVCESGVRHIIGHVYMTNKKYLNDSLINSCYGKTKTIYYDL